MVYRSLATLIVIFWLTMTALLVRKEFGRGDDALREVPVAHVAKLMFLHEQASDLEIYSEKLRVGHLRVHPRMEKEGGRRLVDFTGNMQVLLPGGPRHRLAWTGTVELNPQLALERLQVAMSFREPSAYGVDFTVEPVAKRLTLQTSLGDRAMPRQEYPLDENGVLQWLGNQGIDPALVRGFYSPQSPAPVVRALESSLKMHGEKVDTYLVTIEQGGQTMAEIHISQLGQILRVRTFLGYAAAPEDLAP